MSSARHPAKRDHHTQEKQNPPGNMILLHISFWLNNFVLFPFNFLDLQGMLLGRSSVCPKPPAKSYPFSLTLFSSICVDVFKEQKKTQPKIPQDIFNFNFIVSITHSYFRKARGNTLLLIPLSLEPISIPPQLNTRSCQSHTMSRDPLVEPKTESPR